MKGCLVGRIWCLEVGKILVGRIGCLVVKGCLVGRIEGAYISS